MNIKGLKAYKRIMDTGTLSAAARELNASESALSRQVTLLEAELGLTLFSREKRRLNPTAEGEAFFREAERILDSIEQIPEIVKEIRETTKRRLRIIGMPRMATSIMAQSVAKFMAAHPRTRLSVEIQPRRILERWVASGRYDIGVGALPTHRTGIETKRSCRIPVVAVVPPDHPLASRKSVRIEELAAETLISMPSNTLVGQQVARIMQEHDVFRASSIMASQSLLCCGMVAEGLGITITDALNPRIFGDAVRSIPIEPRRYMDFGLIFPVGATHSKEALQFAEIFNAHAKRTSDRLNSELAQSKVSSNNSKK